MSGDEVIRAWRISDGISHSLDTEVSSPYPESWGVGVYQQTFPTGIKDDAGV